MARRSGFGSVWHREDRGGWFVKWSHRGRPILRKASTGGVDSRDAKKAAKAKLRHVRVLEEKGTSLDEILSTVFGEVTSHRMTFRDAAAHYVANGMTDKKPSTVKNDVYRLRVVCRASWAGKILADVTASDVNRWRHARKKKTSVATANRDVNLASAVFRYAVEMGWAERNPTRDLRGFSEAGRARDTYMTQEEVRFALDDADGVFRPLLTCAIHAGLRVGEIIQLRWRAVDFVGMALTVEAATAKTSRSRRLHMTDTLADELKDLRATQKVKRLDGCDHVFRTASGRPWTAKYLSAEARKFFDGLEGIAASRRNQFCMHLCRHTFASHLAQRGIPLAEVAALLGHSSAYVTARYAHLAPDTGKAAADALNLALGAQRSG